MIARSTLSTLFALATLACTAGAQVVTDGASTQPGHASAHAPANQPASAIVTPQAKLLIDAIDVPLTPETVARAGLTEQQAAWLAVDESATRYTRVRAVGALGVIGTDSARELIELLARADRDEQVRVQAVISLARVWGRTDRAGVVEFLVDRLGDAPSAVADAMTRELDRLYR